MAPNSATSFSSDESLAAEAALADPLEQDWEATGTEEQTQGSQELMPQPLHRRCGR